ncbi:MAG: protein kinase [Anaerolineales bacterium]|jgi:serine/threonine protein kinase|nr:protein kinase [Anaerolineales bacterium]
MIKKPFPSTFGRYQVQSHLKKGGMSQVYLAWDPKLERQVAVKVLAEVDLRNPERRQRFYRDAKLLAKLEHKAIVPIHDFGEQDGLPYIVLAYMPGGSLDDRLDHSKLSPTEALPILQRLAEALDFVHQNDVLHRDIKPGNVLFDGTGEAYLTDFGIARLIHSDSHLTREHPPGTPAYMSPEQVLGQALSPATDIYSLGVLVFVTLSGEFPFPGGDEDAMRQCHVETPPPSLHRLVSKLPAAVDQVIFRSLAKQPEARYPSAEALVQDLALTLQGGRLANQPSTGAYVCSRCGYPLPGADSACPICGGAAVEKAKIR